MPFNILILLALVFGSLLLSENSLAQESDAAFYAIGNPDLTDYYVDPAAGDDSNSGTSRTSPRRSVSSIWNSLPRNSPLTRGVRINLLPGTYNSNHLPNYWEQRRGTASAPVILRALDGFGTVTFSRDINMADVSYFYLLGVSIANRTDDGYGDAFHCEQCDHILLRGNSLNGAPFGRDSGGDIAHETIKFNQSQYIYIENNNIQGADDNAIDWVAVQYGHIRGNRIHDTNSWCTYVKGGSSYILIEGNIVNDCGEGGITAGQGTGFEFMSAPWLRFEANYIKIINNIISDTQGAALGVNGGYSILIAHNTAYRIGSRSHLLEVVFGERSCDGSPSACASRRDQGGWGPAATGSEQVQPIGNQDVIISNNIFYNPSGFSSGFQHFAIYGPRMPTVPGIPSPQRSDTGLQIQGNIIWNGGNSMPLGIEDGDQGCQSSNSSCNESQIRAANLINQLEPDFTNHSSRDFRPARSGVLGARSAPAISDHPALDSTLNPIPAGNRDNQVRREFSGASVTTRPPGAFVSADSSTTPAASEEMEGGTPNPGDNNTPPILSLKKATAKRNRKKISISITALASDSDGITSVSALALTPKGQQITAFPLRARGNRFIGAAKVRSSVRKVRLRVTAVDTRASSRQINKMVAVR